jgi:Flavodoxin
MRGLIVYESMFGSTRSIAEAIAEGLGGHLDVRAARADEIEPSEAGGLDLLVVGAPTHAHGMPRPSTRRGAPAYVDRPDSGLVLEDDADSAEGVREWLGGLPRLDASGAAFDTRLDMAAALTGRASHGIAKALAKHGLVRVAPSESFLVDKHSHLVPGEIERAREWGDRLGITVAQARAASPR